MTTEALTALNELADRDHRPGPSLAVEFLARAPGYLRAGRRSDR
jgi:hypothetical protein